MADPISIEDSGSRLSFIKSHNRPVAQNNSLSKNALVFVTVAIKK